MEGPPVTRQPGSTRILLIETDPWRAESLRAFLLRERYRIEEFDAEGAEPDVALVNLCERAGEVRARVERVKERFPKAQLVAFVREVDSHTVFPCLLMGVKGVLPFDAAPRDIQAAIGAVLSGSIWTPRPVLAQWIDRIATFGVGSGGDSAFTRSEQKVLDGVRDELSNKEIARRLGVREATVKFHIGKLLKKTGTKDRRDLARFVRETMPASGIGA
jgi:DNA-binding NarL/FixJ family response regulator